jgi:hypothetical protein
MTVPAPGGQEVGPRLDCVAYVSVCLTSYPFHTKRKLLCNLSDLL